jgi:hypothetical protein
MKNVEDWAEIRRLHLAERMPIKVIARELGISKNMVKAITGVSDDDFLRVQKSAYTILWAATPRAQRLGNAPRPGSSRAAPTQLPATEGERSADDRGGVDGA